MGIQSHFDDFHRRIKLGRKDDAYKKARERDDSISADVKLAFKEKGYPVVAEFIQGSLATSTAVVPLDGDYDIDRALVIDADSAPDNPVVPKSSALEVLESRGFKNAKIKKPCVTADYASDNVHIDFIIYKRLGEQHYLAVGKKNSEESSREWSNADPRGVIDWINDDASYGDDAEEVRAQFQRLVRYLKRWRDCLRKQPATRYWLVFSAPIPDGVASFAIHLRSASKRPLPLSEQEARAWTLIPYNVRSLSRDALVTRGGGATKLLDRSVLLVGCGSVGSEVAHRLTSAGVGRLTISDPDRFSEMNLYRHTLDIYSLDKPKSMALSLDLQRKHPWATVVAWKKRLEELRDPAILAKFDLIVLAIGSPTLERVFANYCRQQNTKTAALNCWVEAYGIGGHAILGVPGTKGCWHCAYVDPETLGHGLASNLNFLAPNQDLNRTHGGCGIQFLPYSGTAASFTATMAADLAVRFLEGDIRVSSTVSWKGPPIEAEDKGFHLTYRYRHFADSLKVSPLYNPDCDLCAS